MWEEVAERCGLLKEVATPVSRVKHSFPPTACGASPSAVRTGPKSPTLSCEQNSQVLEMTPDQPESRITITSLEI
jgi:hypothetical protein